MDRGAVPPGRPYQQIQLTGGEAPVHHPGAPLCERDVVAGDDPLCGAAPGRPLSPITIGKVSRQWAAPGKRGENVGVVAPLPAASPVTEVITRTEEDTETEDGPVAHIVKVGPGEDAAAKVLEARIEGTPIEALCGHVWVPSRDPKQLPMCQKCKDVYEMYRVFNDGLGDTPRQ